MTTTSPASIRPASTASIAASSPSKTRARPAKWSMSIPATLSTAPLGASEPRRTASPPMSWMGSSKRWMTSPSGAGAPISSMFSPTVRPVTVISSRCNKPSSASIAMTTGIPPTRSMSNMWYLPVGLGVGQVGHLGGDPVEVLQLQVDPGLVGDRQQVQHGVGGSTEGVDHRDGVEERPLGEDVAGSDVLLAAASTRRYPRRTRSRRGDGRRRAPRRIPADSCRAPPPPRPWCSR